MRQWRLATCRAWPTRWAPSRATSWPPLLPLTVRLAVWAACVVWAGVWAPEVVCAARCKRAGKGKFLSVHVCWCQCAGGCCVAHRVDVELLRGFRRLHMCLAAYLQRICSAVPARGGMRVLRGVVVCVGAFWGAGIDKAKGSAVVASALDGSVPPSD